MENSTENNDELLRKAQWGIFMRLLPVTVTLWTLVLIGITDNLVFKWETTQRITMNFYGKHNGEFLSGYYLSWLLVTFDTVNVNVTVPNMDETVVGSYCAAREEQEYKLVGLVFYIIDFILILMIWITVVVTYSKIIYTIVRRRILMGIVSNRSQREQRVTEPRKMNGICSVDEDENTNSVNYYNSRDINTSKFDDRSLSDSNTHETHKNVIAKSNVEQRKQEVNSSASQTKKPTFEFTSAKKPSELNLTLMMITVSMIFILCLTPYFVIRIFIRIVLVTGNEYDFSAGIQFALKLPYLNSAFNPVIYCIFNPKFRRYIKMWFGKFSFGKKSVNAIKV
ncbi:alpha-2A adrenergic receptor-like [Mercenaria mercenaria]|uniref:alpha-2A adrenergic receptor-like n=1 Tax=Mercenaria mercenaria TaxID=6596 RepID=UPI00234F2E4F|nr:alpha-2A adrenergic receptor-like [Mercenaria mercenaria]